jgi:type III secretion protein J
MRAMRGLFVCALFALAGCREPMFSRLSEQDANEIVAVLRQNNISVAKVAGIEQSWGLDVSSDDFARAMVVLRENGLPHAAHATIGELFRKEGLVSTPSEERIRFVFAQQQELENTLSRIDGVIAARVHVVIPQNDPLSETTKVASASVFLKHRTDVDLTASVPQIKALVASSIEGLPHENVSLSMFPSRGLPAAAAPESQGAVSQWAIWAVGGAVLGVLATLATLWARQRGGQAAPPKPHAIVKSARSALAPTPISEPGALRRDTPLRAKPGSV